MTDDTKATIEILEKYWQPGGFYKDIPVEIMNIATGELEEKDKEIEKLNTIIYGIRDKLKQVTESYRPNMSGLYFTVKEFAYDDLDKILNGLNIENKSVLDYACKLEEENERLNNEVHIIKDYVSYLKEEIERLNNIINELEKDVEKRLMSITDNMCDDALEEIKRTTKIAVYQVVLGKLQELKGVDKE